MELRHLRYFVRVAEDRHFGRAAHALGISQPPLSQQIRALEEELGLALFHRTSRRVELTEAGRLFLPEAEAVLAQAARATDAARRIRLGEMGALSIAFASSVPFIPIMGQAFATYRERFPTVRLAFVELNRDAQVERLTDRSIDIGFARGFEFRSLPDEMIATQIVEEPLLVALRDDHPLARQAAGLHVEDLVGQPVVQYHPVLGAGFNDHLSAIFRRRGHDFRIAQEVSGIATLLGLVAAGLGISLIPRSLAALHADHLVYRPLDEADARIPLWMVHHRSLSEPARRFATLLGELLAPDVRAPGDPGEDRPAPASDHSFNDTRR